MLNISATNVSNQEFGLDFRTGPKTDVTEFQKVVRADFRLELN